MNRTVEESHTEKGIFEQRLKRDKGTVMWESRGGGFQREETAGAENEARECLPSSRNSKATCVAEVE